MISFNELEEPLEQARKDILLDGSGQCNAVDGILDLLEEGIDIDCVTMIQEKFRYLDKYMPDIYLRLIDDLLSHRELYTQYKILDVLMMFLESRGKTDYADRICRDVVLNPEYDFLLDYLRPLSSEFCQPYAFFEVFLQKLGDDNTKHYLWHLIWQRLRGRKLNKLSEERRCSLLHIIEIVAKTFNNDTYDSVIEILASYNEWGNLEQYWITASVIAPFLTHCGRDGQNMFIGLVQGASNYYSESTCIAIRRTIYMVAKYTDHIFEDYGLPDQLRHEYELRYYLKKRMLYNYPIDLGELLGDGVYEDFDSFPFHIKTLLCTIHKGRRPIEDEELTLEDSD